MSQPNHAPSWKEEVNQRLAAHKSRRGLSAVETVAPQSRRDANSNVAQAAARVAARYAKAPTYSEMLAVEARSALRTATAATQAALDAQANVQAVLAELEDAVALNASWDSSKAEASQSDQGIVLEQPVQLIRESAPPLPPMAKPSHDLQPFGIRWDADLPVRSGLLETTHASHGEDTFKIPIEKWWVAAPQDAEDIAVIEEIEPAQPIHANLIEFPRELVATRKVRPRLSDPSLDAQLSIFEVDPSAISTLSEEINYLPAPVIADWSSLELDDQILSEMEEKSAPLKDAPILHMASMSRRIMAAVVDGSLITAAFLAVVLLSGTHYQAIASPKQLEIAVALALLMIGIFYQAFFFTLAEATPGMRYAGVSLCTFDNQSPDCGRRLGRLGALLLSLLPIGLGVLWAIFDEEHLSWHDRLSRTYQRQC